MASDRDWESGKGLLGIDDPAEWDAAWERGESRLGTAAIGLALQCSLEEASPRIVRATQLPHPEQRGVRLHRSGYRSATQPGADAGAVRGTARGGAQGPGRGRHQRHAELRAVPQTAVVVQVAVGACDGAEQAGGLVAVVRGRRKGGVAGWARASFLTLILSKPGSAPIRLHFAACDAARRFLLARVLAASRAQGPFAVSDLAFTSNDCAL